MRRLLERLLWREGTIVTGDSDEDYSIGEARRHRLTGRMQVKHYPDFPDARYEWRDLEPSWRDYSFR